jgi:Dolichyl-phosphate-mannose-protein mannosyltransferase
MEPPGNSREAAGVIKRLHKWRVIAFAVLVVVSLAVIIPAYWIAFRAPAVGMFHDDGVYLVTAKALATGHGYRIISLPDEIPQTKYPILFPLVLSLVWRLAPGFPGNMVFLKLVPLTFAVVWFWLTFRLIRQEASREVAAICVTLTAALVWSVYLSTMVLSETMFAALCTGCLLLLRATETNGKNDRHGRRWILAAVLAGLACLTRTAGVCVVATGVICALRQRRPGRAAGFLAISLAVCAPWIWWVLTQHPPQTDAYYSAANYGSWNVFSSYFPPDRKIAVVILNVLMLLQTPLVLPAVRWNGLLEVLLIVAALIVGLPRVKKLTVLDIFLGVYVAMMLAWAWPPFRFVVVVYPLMLLFGWRMWRATLELFPRRAGIVARLAGAAILAAVFVPCLWRLVDSARDTIRVGVPGGVQDSWNDTRQQLDWIRDKTPADAVVLANLDPVFYLYTGRKGVRGFQADPYGLFYIPEAGGHPLGTLPDFRRTVVGDRVTYIVRAANNAFTEAPFLDRLILDLAASEPDKIRLVMQGRDARFQIYHIERPLDGGY